MWTSRMVLASLTVVLVGCAAPASSASAAADASGMATPAAEAGSPHIASPSPVETAPTSPSATPSESSEQTPAASPDLRPDAVAQVVTTDLVVRSLPEISDSSVMHAERLSSPTLLYIVDGPVTADGYDWYLVQPFESELGDVRTDWPFGWVAAGDRTGAEEWIAPAMLECPRPTVDDIRRMAPEARLACFGDEQLALQGRFGGCFAGMTPVWLQVHGCALLPLDPIPAGSPDPGHLRLRFVDMIEIPHDQPGAFITVRGHFDDPRANSCAWGDDAFFEESGGVGPTPPPKPEEVILWCRTEFVATDITVRDGG
jgi:hypothetical protein